MAADEKLAGTLGDRLRLMFDWYKGNAVPDSGEELYPAEAMLSLLEAYRLTRDNRYLDSVERSFTYYKREYYDWGRVQPSFLVFFANWQSQAGRLLFEITTNSKVKDLVLLSSSNSMT
jgi:hypothetical protein